jgi:polysaccharide biosynthesis transport protein
MSLEARDHTSVLQHDFDVVRRRKWIVLFVLVLVPTLALAYSLAQEPRYEATAEVLLNRQNLATSLTGVQDPAAYLPADRLAETQASLARVDEVATRTLANADVDEMSPSELLASSSVTVKTNADVLQFRVRHRDPEAAARLATEYARQYTLYRRALDTSAISQASDEVGAQLRQLRADGDRGSALYAELVEKQEQLRTLETLQTSNASLVQRAGDAAQVQPRTVRNVALAVFVGLILGVLLAFLRNALDTRIRSADEVASRLGLPLLARIPPPARKLRARNRLAMLDEPSSGGAEAFRMLRTNLDFVNLHGDARSLMVTSAIEGEGKSTTAANLAVALARAGRRVALVDLDLRQPALDRFFGLEGRFGFTDVVLGKVPLVEALAQVAVSDAAPIAAANGAPGGVLCVLPSGPLPPNPGEFVESPRGAELLHELRESFDVVIVDSPPLLHVGDAMTVSARVDAIVLVVRLDLLRRRMLDEIARLLQSSPAQKLGFAIAGAEGDEAGYGYGAYGYGPVEEAERATVSRV